MDRFRNLLKMECKKALKNRFFYITLTVGMLFTFMSALYQTDGFRAGTKQDLVTAAVMDNPMSEEHLFNSWIGGESYSLGFTLFFTLMPLLAAFSYGWSQCVEQRTGYTKNVVIRGGKRPYYLAKYIATFLSGGLAVLLPLVFNLLLVACVIPARTPTIYNVINNAVEYGSMWSGLYYSVPVLFVVLYLLLDFLFGGLFAAMSYGLAMFVKNRVAVVLLPFFFLMFLTYCQRFLMYRVYKEISPIYFLHSTCIRNFVDPWIVLAEGLIFFVLPFLAVMRVGVRREIY